MEQRGWGVFGGYSCRRTDEKRVSIVRVIKVNFSFGELKIFQMVQDFKRIHLMSYILIV